MHNLCEQQKTGITIISIFLWFGTYKLGSRFKTDQKIKRHNQELQRNFFASLEIPNLGRYTGIKKMKLNLN